MKPSDFQPTGVNPSGLTLLIRNLGRDCLPNQYLREFVKNSIEACQRVAGATGQIVLDFNHTIYQETGVFKLSITDNGDGMSMTQMLSLLNNLSSSGAIANKYQNYGVGAKISALTRNHAGIQYESWQNGQGYVILICYNEQEDVFGIQGFTNTEGETLYARPIDDEHKPDMISAHGTRVTLLGMSSEQDTMLPPDGMGHDRSAWIVQYLNNRFFTLPSRIRILARTGYFQDIQNSQMNYLSEITGFHKVIDEYALDQGFLRLKGATALWWIMATDSPIKGQTALLNQGEIFDSQSDRSNRSYYFGIIVGRHRVIIYLVPDDAVQNTARTGLKNPDGSDLNWGPWQDQFRAEMPQALQDFLDGLLNDAALVSHANSIHQRLKWLKAFYELCGYVPIILGKKHQPVLEALTPKPMPKPKPALASPPLNLDAPPPPQDDPTKEEIEDQGDLDDSVANFFPHVEWTDETKSIQLTARAAEFLEHTNTVLANLDFKGFRDLNEFFNAKYSGTPDIELLVKSIVAESIEQVLMECVAGILSIKGQPHWNPHQVNSALSKEALTVAVMQRYWLVKHIDQELLKKIQTQSRPHNALAA